MHSAMASPLLHSPLPKRTPWQVQKAVLFALLQRELKARFGGRWLGMFWVLLEPAAQLGLMMSIFVYVRHSHVPGMSVELFLVTGIVPFTVFRKTAINSTGAIEGNRGLFGFRQVKPLDTLIARIALEVVLYSIVYVAFIAGLGWFGQQWLPDRPLELLATSTILVVLGGSLGLVLAVLSNEFPRLLVFARIAFMPLYLMSGVIFPVHNLPSELLDILAWNPVLHLIEFSRSYFATGYPVIEQANLAYPTALAAVMLGAGLALYRVREQRLLAR